ncbi:hypothetical protein EYF80_046185 [Liparis tanakae]|uniref:Uncharacterized protein n=1 Tax=Liparis tanakae TaxID=230148 RepID=A0A4Z2FQU9_9TELE|nr:hypothetical protein EYF80_046185 [Liparis tanakae]
MKKQGSDHNRLLEFSECEFGDRTPCFFVLAAVRPWREEGNTGWLSPSRCVSAGALPEGARAYGRVFSNCAVATCAWIRLEKTNSNAPACIVTE